ncbi:hypothetical protein L873DRAFT_1847440 [Choiromyces venosus 120613-1]|uniref:Uncharacterized protein n=1 Tax=Choiromyces venosus 120613-1 TaxID=1336337 RepID=A0A3N4J7H2_9PEZI|nr:hypothetical protein L873DRAFT_1847440 [Choiromyces venosus 120613-1]
MNYDRYLYHTITSGLRTFMNTMPDILFPSNHLPPSLTRSLRHGRPIASITQPELTITDLPTDSDYRTASKTVPSFLPSFTPSVKQTSEHPNLGKQA